MLVIYNIWVNIGLPDISNLHINRPYLDVIFQYYGVKLDTSTGSLWNLSKQWPTRCPTFTNKPPQFAFYITVLLS